ncbi:MAG TPA: hypothetical protein PK011_11625 [Marinagarivorans sp.]|nr:hypothetical protein [Marinagarivorans sp.]
MKACSVIFLSMVAISASAEEASNLTITNFGVQGAGGGYFRVAQPLVPACLFDVIYIANTNYLSAVLAAKMAGKKLLRGAYFKKANGTCNASLIEIE